MDNLLFNNWEGLLRSFLLTVLAYSALILFIRISGKRTLGKMNAFDFIVTIALGSCLATIALNKNIALAEGALVYFTLIGLQFLITWSSVRIKAVKKLVTGQPAMLVYQGVILENALKRERITTEDVWLAARNDGIHSLEDIEVMILETTGEISVIPVSAGKPSGKNTLANVKGPSVNRSAQ